MKITGILHVGAHDCEEGPDYFKHGVLNENIFWIEAMPHKVEEMKLLHPTYNIYQAVINDVDN
jgi:FkbM family methyltransferase